MGWVGGGYAPSVQTKGAHLELPLGGGKAIGVSPHLKLLPKRHLHPLASSTARRRHAIE